MLSIRGFRNSMCALVGGMAVVVSSGICWSQTTASTSSAPAVVSKSNVLTAVPAEAWGAIVIRDLGQTSKTVDAYATRLGMEPPALQRKVSRMLGIGGKMDTSSPMVIVVMDKNKFGDQPVAVVMSVKDYEGFATGFGAKATETPGLMKGENEEVGQVYFMKKGPFVVMGPTPAIVTAIAGSTQPFSAGLDGASQKLMTASDVYVRVNFQSLNQFIKPFLTMFSAMAQMGSMGGMGGEEGGEGQNAQQAAQMQTLGAVVNVVVNLLDELNGFDVGVKLGADVINASSIVSFKSGQEVAGVLAAQKLTDKALLKGLPKDGFAAAAGWQWQPKATKFQEAMQQIAPPMANPADAEKYKAITKESADLVTGGSFKIDTRPAKPGQPMLNLYAVVETKNSKRYVELMHQSLELQSKMKVPTKGGQDIQMQYKYEAGVTKVGAIAVDQVTLDISKILSMPGMGVGGGELEQVKGFLGTLLGSTSGTIQIKLAPVTDKLVAVSLGADEAALASFIKLAQTAAAPLDDNAKIVQTAKLLPKERFLEGYVDVGRIITAVMTVALGIGGEDAAAMPALPAVSSSLVGVTGSVDGSSVRIDAVVPFDVVASLSSVAKPLANRAASKPAAEDEEKKSPSTSAVEKPAE